MKKTTRTLSRHLEQVRHTEDANRFIEDHATEQFHYFYQYFNMIIGQQDLKTGDVIARSGISKNYVYNILNGDKKNPGRDKILALCIGAGMTYSQTQKGLEIAKVAPLYPKNERDVRIAVAINNEVKDVTKVNLLLAEYGLPLLAV